MGLVSPRMLLVAGTVAALALTHWQAHQWGYSRAERAYERAVGRLEGDLQKQSERLRAAAAERVQAERRATAADRRAEDAIRSVSGGDVPVPDGILREIWRGTD